jgi:hypothetical protein
MNKTCILNHFCGFLLCFVRSSSPLSGTSSGLLASHDSGILNQFVTSPANLLRERKCSMDVSELTVPVAVAVGNMDRALSPEVPCHSVEPRNLMKVLDFTFSVT